MGETLPAVARVDAGEVAAMLGVPKRTIQTMAQRGEITAAQVGRRQTCSRARIQDWITERENKFLFRSLPKSEIKHKR